MVSDPPGVVAEVPSPLLVAILMPPPLLAAEPGPDPGPEPGPEPAVLGGQSLLATRRRRLWRSRRRRHVRLVPSNSSMSWKRPQS